MTDGGASAGGAGFDVRIAWGRNDPAIEADAIALWTRLGILPSDTTPEARAKQIVAAAYSGDRLAAIATAVPEQIGFLRARMLVVRGMTAPEFRRSHAQVILAGPSISALTDWAKANPGEKVAGLIGYVAPGAWGEMTRMPVGPYYKWTLVAYTHDGKQVRVIWFDDFRFD
jgi:hypothetical protein